MRIVPGGAGVVGNGLLMRFRNGIGVQVKGQNVSGQLISERCFAANNLRSYE